MRCPRVWVRTRVEIFRSALPARLINDIFERQDARRAWRVRVCEDTRRRDCAPRKKSRGSRARWTPSPPRKERTSHSFDYYLLASKPSRCSRASLAIVSRDKLR